MTAPFGSLLPATATPTQLPTPNADSTLTITLITSVMTAKWLYTKAIAVN